MLDLNILWGDFYVEVSKYFMEGLYIEILKYFKEEFYDEVLNIF